MKRSNAAQEKISQQQVENVSLVTTIYSSFLVVEFDRNGIILNANQNFTDLMGYTLSEIKGRSHGILVDPAERVSDEYLRFWQNLVAGVKQKGKYKRITKRGEPVWINGNYIPLQDNMGQVVKIINTAFDITTIVKKEMLLTNEVIQLKNRLKVFYDNEVERVIEQIGKPSSLRHKRMNYSEYRPDSRDELSLNMDEKNYKLDLPSSDGLTFVKVSDIIYCQADSNYTIFFLVDGKSIIVSQTLKEYEKILAPYQFFRIHRSYLIKLNMIRQYIRGEGGQIVMINGAILDVAKRRKEEFLNLFLNKKHITWGNS